ncbi:RNA polymerase sigma factor [Catenulispora yoronensis]
MREAYQNWATISSPAAWVRTVAVRVAGRLAARERRRIQAEGAYGHQTSRREVLSPELAAALSEEQRDVVERLAGMPEVRRQVLALAFDGYKVKEIASELSMLEATVRSHLRHIRKALGPNDGGTGGAV